MKESGNVSDFGFSTIDLRRYLNKLERMYQSTYSANEREKILDEMCNILYIICEYDLENKDCSSVVIYDESDKLIRDISIYYGDLLHVFSTVPRYRMYFSDIRNFERSVRPFINGNKSMCDDSSLNLTKLEMIDAVRDFYRSTNTKFYNYFDNFMKTNGNNIKFNATRSCNDSFLFRCSLPQNMYIDIGIDDNVENIVGTLVHECGHAIAYSISNNINDKKKFSEIESLFFEILSDDFFEKYFGNSYFRTISNNRLNNYYIDAREMLFYKRVNKVFKKLNNLDNPYEEFASLSFGDYKKSGDIVDIMNYLYSYIVALELKEMYDEDKDYTLDILEKIIKNDDKMCEYDLIKSNVSPNKRLIKYLKRLNL